MHTYVFTHTPYLIEHHATHNRAQREKDVIYAFPHPYTQIHTQISTHTHTHTHTHKDTHHTLYSTMPPITEQKVKRT